MPIAAVNGIHISYDVFANAGADEAITDDQPVLVMISGLGAQSWVYDDDLCMAFADRGLTVVRFDNRDIGLSTFFDDRPDGDYLLSDMGADTLALMDHLGVDRAHVWGASMGGMIAQTIAISHPERVLSLISVMSNTGEVGIGFPDPEIIPELLELMGPAATLEEAIDSAVRTSLLVGSPEYATEEWLVPRHTMLLTRSCHPSGTTRQFGAVMASGSRAEGLAELAVPTLVLHGNRDRLIDISGGRRTAELVAGSSFIEIDGMGHDLHPNFWAGFVDEVTRHVSSVEMA